MLVHLLNTFKAYVLALRIVFNSYFTTVMYLLISNFFLINIIFIM